VCPSGKRNMQMKVSVDRRWNDTDRGNRIMDRGWNDTDRGNRIMDRGWNDTDRGNRS